MLKQNCNRCEHMLLFRVVCDASWKRTVRKFEIKLQFDLFSKDLESTGRTRCAKVAKTKEGGIVNRIFVPSRHLTCQTKA